MADATDSRDDQPLPFNVSWGMGSRRPSVPSGHREAAFDDNVSCFRDPANRESLLAALEFIPLDREGDVYLSLGGEVRERYEYTHDPLFGADPQDETGVWLQRYMLHGDLHLGPHIRLFGQLFSALEAGRAGGPSPVDENELEVQNGFLDLSFAPRQDSRLTLRAGRQELRFGSGRLVDLREGPNVRRTFDAARAIVEFLDSRVDGLIARPRATEPGVFDDDANDDQALWGVYATSGASVLLLGRLDLYYLGFRDDAGAFAQGAEEETRHSVGARFWGEAGNWDWNWEGFYQFGSFGDGAIHAWTLASETGYTWFDPFWRPRFALSANIASGDSDPDDANLGTFNPLFPRGNYFSEDAVLGPRNFFNFHPFVTVDPTEDWSITVDMNFFWRLETEDGVYSPSGLLIREANGSDERFVGSAVSLTSDYAITERLSFTAIYTHFFAGGFIEATRPSDDIDFLEFTLQFRF